MKWTIAHPALRRALSWLVLLVLLVVTYRVRLHNWEEVFHGDGKIYFIEGDCYSRMTRAQMVEQGQWVIRKHEFENWPQGTTPHTTAPFDWMIVGLKKVIAATAGLWDRGGSSVLRTEELDLAGALISPLLGVLTALWLWWWAGRLRLPFRAVMVLFFAVCPILVHGTILGRPDHQSLLILLLAIAVGSEFALADLGTPAKLAKRWAVAAGAAWGLALWVSLYEPLVFFAGAMGRHVWTSRTALTSPAVRGRWLVLAGIFVVALLIDGWRLSLPDATLREHFAAWSATIGELKHLDLSGGTVWEWTGLFGVGAFGLLWLAARADQRAWSLLLLIAVTLLLTVWQLRWGYFLALAVAFSIPWQLGALRMRSWGWVVGGLALFWPAKISWDRFHPSEELQERNRWQRTAQEYWRRAAEFIRSPEKRPFLAPWWASPQVAYWSGQPGVAGTSHQSLAGILDTANFFLTDSTEEAAEILRAHGVRAVIIDDLAHDPKSEEPKLLAISNSELIVGLLAPPDALGDLLAGSPKKAPAYLQYITPKERGLVVDLPAIPEAPLNPDLPADRQKVTLYKQQFLQLYLVDPTKFPPKL